MEIEQMEFVDVPTMCEVEVTDHQPKISPVPGASFGLQSDDQQLLKAEIKEEEMEDAKISQEISQQGKRLLLKDWLIKKLDSNEAPETLCWLNKEDGLFRIKWLHKATDSWEVMADGALFKEWCIHTGKYDANNENPRKWKANFRCALNSLPDVVIVPPLCVRKGKDAYRVFKILPEKIPEKVREKQESSRKRRREKRETLLKAYAKSQAEAGNVERAEAITKQMAVNMNNIKIHLKKGSSCLVNNTNAEWSKSPKISRILTPTAGVVQVSSTAATPGTGAKAKGSRSGPKTALNGMDALCTAAAMMADDDAPEEGAEESVTVVVSAPQDGDVVTYYTPIVPSTLSTDTITTSLLKGKVPAVVCQAPTVSVTDGVTGAVTDGVTGAMTSGAIGTVTSGVTGAVVTSGVTGTVTSGVLKSATPVKLGSANISTSSGNMLLSVRLAQTSSPASTATAPAVTTVPQIQGLPPGVCIQPFSPSKMVAPGHLQQPTYLIPKTLLQQQIAASAGNQPARVFTIKPANIAPSNIAPTGKLVIPELVDNSRGGTRASTPKLVTASAAPKPSKRAATTAVSSSGGVMTTSAKGVTLPVINRIDYAHLKANISRLLDMEGSALKFQLVRHTELIKVVRLYDSDKPSVEVALIISPDYTFNVLVHNRSLLYPHELIKKQGKTIKSALTFKHFLEKLNEYVTCIGNPEEMAHKQYADYSSFISAYQEPDMGAKNEALRYHSTIRSSTCQLLVKAPGYTPTYSDEVAKELYRCEECSRMRVRVLSMRGLFSLLDGSKVPDTVIARKRRLMFLKEFTSKDVLANRVDMLETQLRRFKQVLPSITKRFEKVKSVDEECSEQTSLGDQLEAASSHDLISHETMVVTSEENEQVSGEVTTYSSELADHCNTTGESQIIQVTLAPPTDSVNDASTDLSTNSYTVLVDGTVTSNSELMLVTEDDNMPTTERLLEELSNNTLDGS